MRAAEKAGMKVIYGMGAYMVNDRENLVHGNESGAFTDEYVVFDKLVNKGVIKIYSLLIESSHIQIMRHC